MNKVFNVIWNISTNSSIVVSELVRNKKKSSSKIRTILLSSLIFSIFPNAFAVSDSACSDIDLTCKLSTTWTPKYNNNKSGSITINNGGHYYVNGPSNFIAGYSYYKVLTNLSQLIAGGYLIGQEGVIPNTDANQLLLGGMENIVVIDPITGKNKTISVYNSNLITTKPTSDINVGVSNNDLDTLNVYNDTQWLNISNGSANIDIATERINLGAIKSSDLIYVDGRNNDAQINWLSNNNITTSIIPVYGKNQRGSVSLTETTFSGEIITFSGDKFTINDVDDFKSYNNYLIAKIKNGDLSISDYQSELNRGYKNSLFDYEYYLIPRDKNGNPIDGWEIVSTPNNSAIINAIGAKALVEIDANSRISHYLGNNFDSYLIKLSEQAVGINNGIINSYRGNDVLVEGASVFTNKGTINSGYGDGGQFRESIKLTSKSLFNNDKDGILNISPFVLRINSINSLGINANDSTINNYGAINVGYKNNGLTDIQSTIIGALLKNNANFINHIGGIINLAQDMDGNALKNAIGSIGVSLTENSYFTNNGLVNFSSATNGLIGILADNSQATNSSNGLISLNGNGNNGNFVPYVNIGMQAIDKGRITNDGTINVNGTNNIALQALSGGTIYNNGTININGSSSINGLINYGIRVEDENSTATLAGIVNLAGDGAIGVHARNKGEVYVTKDGEVNFKSGENQTGYFIYGSGSIINNDANSIEDVSTLNSTLYRIDGGAYFSGLNSTTGTFDASGVNSTIMRVTGKNSKFNSDGLVFNVIGEGATGVRIEGGAIGEITDNTSFTLSGNNTTAGIVDGYYYNVDGTINYNLTGDSVLISRANIETSNTADSAFGYIAKNGGKLIHEGNINFTADNSTGILIDGGILDNRSKINVNGTAINIQGKDSQIKNIGTVTATGGTAAYLVGKGASLTLSGNGETNAQGSAHGILLDIGATGLSIDDAIINMDNLGSGNGIENRANVKEIQLKNTTINVGNGVGIHTGTSLATTNSGTININGSGTGILFEDVINGSITDNLLDISSSKNLVINVNSSKGNGIITRSSSDVKTGASVNILDKEGSSALVVQGITKNVEQSGKLTSISEKYAVVDINNSFIEKFTNSGDILAVDRDHHAIEMTKGNGIIFTNATGANIQGQVDLLSGDNTIILQSGSTANDINSGSGKNSFILQNITEDENDKLFLSLNGGGEDTLILDNSKYILALSNVINSMDYIKLVNNSIFTLDNISLTLGRAKFDTQDTGYHIDDSSMLVVKSDNDLSFNSHLEGNGTLFVDTNNGQFNFTNNNADDGFNGTVALSNSQFELAGLNTKALTNATLSLESGNITHVGKGQQKIKGLKFNGGTASFENVTPGNTTAGGTIDSESMDLLGYGTIQVDSGVVSNDQPVIDPQRSLLEQDDGHALILLATSDSNVQGNAGNLSLVDRDGNIISDSIDADISQNNKIVAKGTYDYRLTSGDKNDGLYISYGLTQVELLGRDDDALLLDANNKTGNAADLSAKITGSGDLAFGSQSGQTVSLSNMDNDYTGVTEVRSGNLLMLNDHVLGNTSELKLAAETLFDMNNHSQTIGKLNSMADSILNINDGSLTITNGGTSSGSLMGGGKLHIADDILVVNGINKALSAVTTIAVNAQAVLNNTLGLGTGDMVVIGKLALNSADGVLYNNVSDSGQIALNDSSVTLAGDNSNFVGQFTIDQTSQLISSNANQLGSAEIYNQGALILNSISDWTLKNVLSGDGDLIKQGSGRITLASGSASYIGTTEIQQGELISGRDDQALMLASQQINIAKVGKFSGFGGTAGNIDNAGTFQLGSGVNSPTHTFTVGGNLINSGLVTLGVEGQSAGNQLIINGNYQGNNGLLHFNTILADDSSVTDKLQINGDSSGDTRVSISNAGGTGAQTLHGIEIIQVNGNSAGEFIQEGRIAAGAYDYSLVRGSGNNHGNWYLTSQKNDNGSTPAPEEKPKQEPNLRPEGGSYIANLAAANTLFNTRLHDRLGNTEYIDVLTGEKKVTSLWLRQVVKHNNWRDSRSQLKTHSNSYVVQLGGDITQWSMDGLDRGHLGLMAGYTNSNNKTHSSTTGYRSKGSIDGYSVGAYSTWFANDTNKNGLYVDSWLQYSWFNNQVSGDKLASESYKSKGLTASMEAGYTFNVGAITRNEGSVNELFIQPQAQITWMGIKADDHIETNGTHVKSEGDGNLQTRLGLRSYLKNQHTVDDKHQRDLQPFVEVNWLHNTHDYSAKMDGARIRQAGASNLGEVKIGIDGKINSNINLWGNVGTQIGGNGYNDTSAVIGFKIHF